jgi:1-acyl-sn-glycerol-3-phosphate acyltransferase
MAMILTIEDTHESEKFRDTAAQGIFHPKGKPYSIFIYPFRVIGAGIGYTSYFLAIVIFLSLGVPLLLVLSFNHDLMKKCMYRTLKTYTFFLTRFWLPFLRVYSIAEISGFDTRTMANSIFVANHRGKLDALLLLSLLPETGVLIKPKYSRLAIYSTFVKYLDFIKADSDSPGALSASLGRCRALLDRGKNLLVFPEGTRAKTGKLQAFREFCFKVSLDTGRPVVPVIIHSDYPFMARTPQSIFPKYRFRYTVRFLAPCTGLANERPADFADRVYRTMSEALDKLDKGTFWDRNSERGDNA